MTKWVKACEKKKHVMLSFNFSDRSFIPPCLLMSLLDLLSWLSLKSARFFPWSITQLSSWDIGASGSRSPGSNSMHNPYVCVAHSPSSSSSTWWTNSESFGAPTVGGCDVTAWSRHEAKAAEYVDSSHLRREIPAMSAAAPSLVSFIPFASLTVINDPQLLCASSLTLPSFFSSCLRSVSQEEGLKWILPEKSNWCHMFLVVQEKVESSDFTKHAEGKKESFLSQV